MTEPKNNHPNLHWRRAMHEACTEWLSRWRWPDDGDAGILTPEQLRDLMSQSYRDGFEAGRASTTRAKDPT